MCLLCDLSVVFYSGLHREIKFPANGQPIQDVIQTNVAINRGNTGGPLFDSAGRLVGINTAIHSSIGEFCGVAFSIAIHSVSYFVAFTFFYS